MEITDILTLARAGFTAEQIAQIATADCGAPVVQNANPAPVAPVAPVAPAVQTPAPTPAPVAPIAQPIVTDTPAPVQAPAPAPDFNALFAPITAKIDNLASAMQAQNIAQTQMPPTQTGADIIAQIINPHYGKEK